MEIVVVVIPSGSKTASISSEFGSTSRNSGSAPVSISATVTFSSSVLVVLPDCSLSELGVFLHFFGGGASSYSELESLPVSLEEELELELAEDEEDEVFRLLLVRRCVAEAGVGCRRAPCRCNLADLLKVAPPTLTAKTTILVGKRS